MHQPENYKYTEGLTSARLVTRFVTEADTAAWAGFFEDGESTRYLPNLHEGPPIEKSGFWIRRQLNRYANQEFGHQALIEKSSGKLVGQCGLLLQLVNGQQEIEVGYHLLKESRGLGYATEAAKLFIDHAFKYKLCASVISIIDVNNLSSQRVAERNGLQRENSLDWNGLNVFIYRIHK